MTKEHRFPWATEADLVADFVAWVEHKGWTVYAETAGWDLLLVRPSDGYQIGVEAKMQLNAHVLCQALGRHEYHNGAKGPDSRAVLVPRKKSVNGMETLAQYLGLVVILGDEPRQWDKWKGPHFSPNLPDRQDWSWVADRRRGEWPELCPDERCDLPDYVPDVQGGKPSPVSLTPWKVKAIKIQIVIERRGYVTRADFAALKIDPSRWTQYWLQNIGQKRWVPYGMPDLKAQHPINYEQIKADWPKWSKDLGAEQLALPVLEKPPRRPGRSF